MPSWPGDPWRAIDVHEREVAADNARVSSPISPRRKSTPRRSTLSNTKGISIAWHAPRAPLNAVDLYVNRYEYVEAWCADCASARRTAGMRNTQSVAMAHHSSWFDASGI